ncbi:MAG: hypothetical protein ACLR10_06990 [Oscillospiraceae bacterium]
MIRHRKNWPLFLRRHGDRGDFGNGRYVRNILEKAKMAQATRLLTQDYESLTQKGDHDPVCRGY